MAYEKKSKKTVKFSDKISKILLKKGNKTSSAPEREKVFFAPEKDMGTASYVIGFVCRAVVIFLAIFGLMLLVFESVGIYQKGVDFRTYVIPMYAMVLICIAASLVCSFASFNKITRIALPAAGVIGVAAWIGIKSDGNFFRLLENAGRRLYNDVLYGVAKKGFTPFMRLMLEDTYSYSKEILHLTIAVLFAAALAVIMYFAVSGKARLWLFSLTVAVFTVPVLILNLPGSNTGFALTVASIIGFVALWTSDRRFGGTYEKRKARKARRDEKAGDRKTRRYEKRLENLKLKEAADRIYETALEAGVGKTRAVKARRSVYKRVFRENFEEKKRERDLAKEERKKAKLLKKEEKKKKDTVKNLSASQRAEVKEKEKAEKKLLAAEKKAERAEKAKKKREERAIKRAADSRNRAAGGYAGAVAAAVALLALWLPSALSSKPFPIIGFIDKQVDSIRAYTDDVLMGDDVNLNEGSGALYSSFENFNFEALTFEPRKYEGNTIFLLDSEREDPVYLKSRTALSFDIENGKWSYPTTDDIIDFREKFGDGFSSDEITTGAYTWLYPSSSIIPQKGSYLNFSRYGFTVQQIHVYRVNGRSRLMFVPSTMNRDTGVLKRGNTDLVRGSYTPYFDGIYTSRQLGGKTNGYSTVSYIYNLNRSDIGDVFWAESYILDLTYDFAERERKGASGEDLAALYDAIVNNEPAAVSYQIDLPISNDLGKRYLTSMTDEEKKEFLEFAETEQKYRDYVYETYTDAPVSSDIRTLALQIKMQALGKDGNEINLRSRHDIVMAVINYLCSDEYTYTLTPASPEEPDRNTLETFLFDTKEGYCSHFATAAVVLLRHLGVPARLAEGYIANDWGVSPGTIWVSKYGCTVLDSDAHTWIEVYYDGIGWIPYEATKTFAEEIYAEPEEEEPDDGENGPSGGGAATVDPPDDDGGEDEDDNNSGGTKVPVVVPPVGGTDGEGVDAAAVLRQFRTLIIVVVSAIALYFIVFAIVKAVRRKADKAVQKRYDLVTNARNEEFFRDESSDNRAVARHIDDCIFEIFSAVGIGPEKGELLEDFGRRLKKEYRDLSTMDPEYIMSCVQKEEFGHGLTFTELSDLAEYLSDIMVTVYTGLTPMQKFRLRYIKHII